VTIALGAGANAAVFAVAYGVLLKPLPFAHPERPVAVWPNHFMSQVDLRYLRERARGLAHLSSVAPDWTFSLTGAGDPSKITIDRVSADLFQTLEARPLPADRQAFYDRLSFSLLIGRLAPQTTFELPVWLAASRWPWRQRRSCGASLRGPSGRRPHVCRARSRRCCARPARQLLAGPPGDGRRASRDAAIGAIVIRTYTAA